MILMSTGHSGNQITAATLFGGRSVGNGKITTMLRMLVEWTTKTREISKGPEVSRPWITLRDETLVT